MRNTGLDEAQAGIKIARRNTNNLRYSDDTSIMAEREEELKSLLMKVKEESEKVGLKLEAKLHLRIVNPFPFASLRSKIGHPFGKQTATGALLALMILSQPELQDTEHCLLWGLHFNPTGRSQNKQRSTRPPDLCFIPHLNYSQPRG